MAHRLPLVSAVKRSADELDGVLVEEPQHASTTDRLDVVLSEDVKHTADGRIQLGSEDANCPELRDFGCHFSPSPQGFSACLGEGDLFADLRKNGAK
jgi:hypothetical protein